MRQEIFLFALPTPVLTGSGSLSIISVPMLIGTPHCVNIAAKLGRFFLLGKKKLKKEDILILI